MPFPPPDTAHDAATGTAPPAASTPSSTSSPQIARPGDLTGSWRVMLGLGWVSAFFAYAGVWQASVQIGIGTWWVGPRAQPTNIAIKLIPFYVALIVGLLIAYNVRWILRWSALGVAAAVLISIPDFSRSTGLGAAEAIIAALLGVITLASLSGRYRTVEAEPAVNPAPTSESAPPDPAAQ